MDAPQVLSTNEQIQILILNLHTSGGFSYETGEAGPCKLNKSQIYIILLFALFYPLE